ncbi:HAMP domain-containing sensor histidine kinase [Saccharopolyspora shandongensis]|uniref:HAMP domain-containing sensor histidine kinase n=1 Tax=Saccharopolyspora shandongensis TaxID=418495 RepID=UPI003437A841
MNRRWWNNHRSLGLRARLLLAFVLLCLVTATAVAGGIYVQARNAILQRAQDAAVEAMTSSLSDIYPLRSSTPGPAELGEIAAAVTDRDSSAAAMYRDTSSSTGLTPTSIPEGLRQAVSDGDIAWQRVVRHGVPTLIIGTPLLTVQPDGTTRASGIEVYSARSLVSEQRSINQLATTAWTISAGALALAILLALLAARGVLRPARELGRAAQLLGTGELRTRIAVRGSDELADVARTFNNTAAELERHVEQLRAMEADARRFVADVSHELRTPLAALAAVTDVLDEEAAHLPGHAGRAARLVSQEAHNLSRLVNDLIEISRFDSGVAALELDEIDVTALVHATLRTRGWAERVDSDLPTTTMARLDPRRVDVIIANLVGNALRHGEPPVSVRLHADAEWIAFEVRDHGPGVDPSVLPHVFDRFYKADAARTRSDGSGLGLAIARENARLHRDGENQGDLTAANAPDSGAVFTMRLPRRAHQSSEEDQ